MNTMDFPIGTTKCFHPYDGNAQRVEVVKLPKGTYITETVEPAIKTKHGETYGGKRKEDIMFIESDIETYIRVPTWKRLFVELSFITEGVLDYGLDGSAKITRLS